MYIIRNLHNSLKNNFCVILGIVLGLLLSTLLSQVLDTSCQTPTVTTSRAKPLLLKSPPRTVAPAKKSPSSVAKLIRPRYYSTELGIREKLFVGIFTSEDKVDTQAVHLNHTIGHLVNRIKFFMTAKYKSRNKLNLTGLVGFTDTRAKYRPFQVFKYIGDNFGSDYDYYFLGHDHTFINGHGLNDLAKGVSVSKDVYLGTRVTDSSYCSLDSGILMSNSVVKAIRGHLDWCIVNAVSDDHDENIGRCVHHSIGLTCQQTIGGRSLTNYKLRHFDLEHHLLDLSKRNDFNRAITISPVLKADHFYLLNAYFLRLRLEAINVEINRLSLDLSRSDGAWPPGVPKGAKPATRFDVTRQHYFNDTHIYFPDDFTSVRSLSSLEREDLENILDDVRNRLNASSRYKYRRFVNGYKSFDLSRGMDYTLDLGYRDLTTGKEIVKRFQVSKPLSKVELVTSAPYVTESSRVTLIVTVQINEVNQCLDFVNAYYSIVEKRKEKTFLMLALLYQNTSDNKGDSDVFSALKKFVLSKTSSKEEVKVAWVSIRLPPPPSGEATITLENIPSLNFAVIDLSLKKIGLDSLILYLDCFCDLSADFLNRVRMNTIMNYQIFSPIPFRLYNPKISQDSSSEINKNTGHFDREEYKFISFYGRDYVQARKKFHSTLPIVKVDNDIGLITGGAFRLKGNVFDMFVVHGGDLHCMRATESQLKIKYHEYGVHSNWFLGSETQLGKFLLRHRDRISEL